MKAEGGRMKRTAPRTTRFILHPSSCILSKPAEQSLIDQPPTDGHHSRVSHSAPRGDGDVERAPPEWAARPEDAHHFDLADWQQFFEPGAGGETEGSFG